MDESRDIEKRRARNAEEARQRLALPFVTNDEREFWRRAVEIERRRQRSGRPAPFPFQPA